MSDNDICGRCPQQDKCRDVYDRMGQFAGPSLFFKVILAFLLPLVIFVVSLAVFERCLADVIEIKSFQTLASFAGAGGLVFIYTIFVSLLTRQKQI